MGYSSFKEWYSSEMCRAHEQMSPPQYENYKRHEKYFQTSWDARQDEIEKLKKERDYWREAYNSVMGHNNQDEG